MVVSGHGQRFVGEVVAGGQGPTLVVEPKMYMYVKETDATLNCIIIFNVFFINCPIYDIALNDYLNKYINGTKTEHSNYYKKNIYL